MKYGRITPLSFHHKKGRLNYWLCECDCGVIKQIDIDALKFGRTKSCGCLQRERVSTHRKSNSRAYHIWEGMIQRCTNRKAGNYQDYGGRGITVCSSWKLFENFYLDMGDPPPQTSLDRIDNRGNYSPGNCRWASSEVQSNNTSRSRFIEFEGKIKTLSQWARDIGVNPQTLQVRIDKLKWPIEKALTKHMHKGDPLVKFTVVRE